MHNDLREPDHAIHEDVETHFAPAARCGPDQIRRQVELISDNPLTEALQAAADGLMVVLNEQRQVVALNARLLDMLGVDEPTDVLGLRPGEAVSCSHAHDHPGGCGTGRMCASCGALEAVMAAMAEDCTAERLCCIQTEHERLPADLFLSVRARPFELQGRRWVMVFLKDVSAHQSWELLQRVFFHDVGNIVTALMGSAYTLQSEVPAELTERARGVMRSATLLANEVTLQRMLLRREAGEFELQLEEVGLDEVLAELGELCEHHPARRGRRIRFEDRTRGAVLQTDPVVLNRVLANMVINALEATGKGGQVDVWCEARPGRIVFCVCNPGEMPVEVAGRVFQRNFSTKGGLSRGLGTFSMKLFGETILGGEVDFSSPGTGRTTFSFSLPVDPGE